MFFNTSNAINSSNSDLDLASLITLNTADAEFVSFCIGSEFKVVGTSNGWNCYNNQGNSCCPIR